MSGQRATPGTEPVDPDLGSRPRGSRAGLTGQRRVLAAIAVGGMVGACARHALELAWPAPAGGFPWATLVTNVSGCVLIGLVMVWVVEVGGAHPLVRPFVGVGVLGGYTTFSTYAVQTQSLLRGHHPGLALGYLLGTALAALLGVAIGVAAARGVVRFKSAHGRHEGRQGEEAR